MDGRTRSGRNPPTSPEKAVAMSLGTIGAEKSANPELAHREMSNNMFGTLMVDADSLSV
jgi:hypothetical protein